MPDTETSTAQAATTETIATTAATSETGQEPKTFDAAYVSTLRAEAAAHRKEASEAKARIKGFEDEKLSETERLKKQSEEAQAAARTATEKATTRITRAVALGEASKLGFADPDDAYALIDVAKIERDADGEPTNLDALLQDLAKRKPYLLGTTAAAAARTSTTNPARSHAAGATFTTSQIADRTFWNANKDAIMAALHAGQIIDD